MAEFDAGRRRIRIRRRRGFRQREKQRVRRPHAGVEGAYGRLVRGFVKNHTQTHL